MPDTAFTPAELSPAIIPEAGDRSLPIECAQIEVVAAPQLSFAHVQNGTPLISKIRVTNATAQPLDDLTLEMVTQPAAVHPISWHLSSLPANQSLDVAIGPLTPDFAFLDGLNETERGTFEFTLRKNDLVLARTRHPVEVLARNHWGGMGTSGSLLAAYGHRLHAHRNRPHEQRQSRSLATLGSRPCRRPQDDPPRRPHAVELDGGINQHQSDRTHTHERRKRHNNAAGPLVSAGNADNMPLRRYIVSTGGGTSCFFGILTA